MMMMMMIIIIIIIIIIITEIFNAGPRSGDCTTGNVMC